MVPVTIAYTAAETCGPVTTTLSVTSDEPVTGSVLHQGLAGLTSPDWQLVGSNQVLLRAERSLRGDGRVYTIQITATDAAGGRSTHLVTVTVPRFILGFLTKQGPERSGGARSLGDGTRRDAKRISYGEPALRDRGAPPCRT
jgi:hypothetical protein